MNLEEAVRLVLDEMQAEDPRGFVGWTAAQMIEVVRNEVTHDDFDYVTDLLTVDQVRAYRMVLNATGEDLVAALP